jgi:prevent-host-death family protein
MSSGNEKNVSLAEAKARLAECVREVERGSTIVLTRHGRPVARLVPLDGGRGERVNEVRERLSDYEPLPAPPLSDGEARRAALQRLLESEIWPQIPQEMIGRGPTKEEREEILGIREEGT